jgi:predicted nucleic-acid-binding protein
MIGIDTNCLLRYSIRDDIKQHAAIEARIIEAIENNNEIFINNIVLSEFVWVLESNYKFSRDMVLNALTGLLEGQQFAFEKKEVVQRALHDFKSSRAGFTDCLLAAKNKLAGCTTTLTFDRAAAKLENFEHV